MKMNYCIDIMRLIAFTTLILMMACCASKQEDKPSLAVDSMLTESPVDLVAVGDSLEIPAFEIQVDLDEKADQKISSQHETIIVQAFLLGTPKDSADPERVSKLRELGLGAPRIELDKPGIAKFEKIKISKKDYQDLADKDFTVLINVASGRKSSNDNLLDCEMVQEPISKMVGRTHTLKGKLIHE